jgi:hypothetical protein
MSQNNERGFGDNPFPMFYGPIVPQNVQVKLNHCCATLEMLS